MADIAEAAGVSPQTVFNYFGTKDGILIALITEGSNRSRATRAMTVARDDADFPTIVVDMMAEVSSSTLGIADKRIWRYAEAAAIRHPRSELAQKYAENDRALVRTLNAFFDHYDMRLRSGQPADPEYLAKLYFDVWTAEFFDLIRHEERDLPAHRERLCRSLGPLTDMLFDPDFLTAPKLKPQRTRNAHR